MGRIFTCYLDDSAEEKVYECSKCGTHITRRRHVVSKSFQGRTGPAFLVTDITNVTFSEPEARVLMTGRHLVADAQCVMCGEVLGWKYIEAQEQSQKYKENKYIVERSKINRGPSQAA